MTIGLFAAGMNVRWFMADAYSRFAENQSRFADTRPAARQAAVLAQKLGFRDARALQALAQSDLYSGQKAQALEEYERALELAPADAFLWRDYALARLDLGLMDERLEHAVVQAQTLAPRSAPLHLTLALAGLKVYGQSSPALQARWLTSIRFTYLLQPGGLFYSAFVAGQDLMLCQQVVPQSESNPWCIEARWQHGLCQSSQDHTSCSMPARAVPK